MFKVLVLVVALAACVSCAPADEKKQGICAGCPVEHDVNDPELLTNVNTALAQTNSNNAVKKIVSYKTQIVAGTKYIVEIITTDDKNCTLKYVMQVWISKEPQFVTFNCQ